MEGYRFEPGIEVFSVSARTHFLHCPAFTLTEKAHSPDFALLIVATPAQRHYRLCHRAVNALQRFQLLFSQAALAQNRSQQSNDWGQFSVAMLQFVIDRGSLG